MKKILLSMVLCLSLSANASLIQLESVSDFERLVEESNVPVMVQFSAYWCGPCKNLEATLRRVASSYSDSQVRIAKVDAYVHSSLGKYLQGGYPTVRTFHKGQTLSKAFTGSKGDSEVKSFIEGLINNPFMRQIENFCPVSEE